MKGNQLKWKGHERKELNAHVRKGIYMKGQANLEFTTATPYEAVFGLQSSTPLPN